MPPGRANRGGRRSATPNTNYTNRSDLQSRQPVINAPSKVYGQATQLQSAQQAIPLPGGGAQAGPMPMGQTGASTQPAGQPALGQGPLPGELGPLHAPTNNPNEPVTHGLPTGAGGGPEVLTPPNPLVKAAAVLNNLGGAADPATQALRDKVNAQLGNEGAA